MLGFVLLNRQTLLSKEQFYSPPQVVNSDLMLILWESDRTFTEHKKRFKAYMCYMLPLIVVNMGKVSVFIHKSVQEALDLTAEILGTSRSETIEKMCSYVMDNDLEGEIWEDYEDLESAFIEEAEEEKSESESEEEEESESED